MSLPRLTTTNPPIVSRRRRQRINLTLSVEAWYHGNHESRHPCLQCFVSTGHPCIIRAILTVYNNAYTISIINTYRYYTRGTYEGSTAVDKRERHNLPVLDRCAHRHHNHPFFEKVIKCPTPLKRRPVRGGFFCPHRKHRRR